MALRKDPITSPKITAMPREDNILEWHYVIEGTGPYQGGYYHGKLVFPSQYPMKPPGVIMCTPNGRFLTDRRLCLSMSDFHPETWNPMWSVATVLMGLYSFMLDNSPTAGSIVTGLHEKRRYAQQSLEYNVRNPVFCKLFPEYVEIYEKQRSTLPRRPSPSDAASSESMIIDMNGLLAAAAGLVAIVSIVLAMLRFL
jgi:ubiquitin-conjugating enzyme E2 J2